MDVIIQTTDFIYIIECKMDRNAEEALQQIEEKNYAAPFAMDKRTVSKLVSTSPAKQEVLKVGS